MDRGPAAFARRVAPERFAGLQSRQRRRELLAPDTAEEPELSRRRPHRIREDAQRPVSRQAAELVVHSFEAVDVADEQRERRPNRTAISKY